MSRRGAGKHPLERKELKVILSGYEPRPLPVSAVYPHGRLVAAKVRGFLAMAASAFASDPAPGAGS